MTPGEAYSSPYHMNARRDLSLRMTLGRNMNLVRNFFAIALTFVVAAFVPARTEAQVLIIQSSDGHSDYERLPSFLAMVEQKRSAFLSRHPEGRVLVLLGGDVFGAGPWTRFNDRGWLGVRAIAQLARTTDVVFAPGNHDAFDWGQVDGHNGLAFAQFRELSSAGVAILAANARWGADSRNFGGARRDFEFADGRRLRVAGFTLSRFWDRTHAAQHGAPSVFESVRSVRESLADEVQLAARDGVTAIVPFAHEYTIEMIEAVRSVQAHERSAFVAGLRMPVAFAGHDHLRARMDVGGVEILNASDEFSTWITELDIDLRVVGSRFLAGPSIVQRYRPSSIQDPGLRSAAAAISSHVGRVRAEAGYGIPFSLRSHRGLVDENLWISAFEIAMADVIAFASTDPVGAEHAIGLYGGRRPENALRLVGGSQTLGQIAGRFAWGADPIVAFRFAGRDFIEMLRDMRSDFEAPEIPIPLALSSNLRLNQYGRPEIHRGHGLWTVVEKEESLLVAFDPRLFRVPSRSGGWRAHLRGHVPEVQTDLYKAILEYGHAAFEGARWNLPRHPASVVACGAYFAR